MKKICLLLLAALPILCASCDRKEDPGKDTSTFRLTATIDGFTRTSFDPETMAVTWKPGDFLTVFNSNAQTAGWSGNMKFRLDDASAGTFKPNGGVTVKFNAGEETDWVVIYPYDEAVTNPESMPSIPTTQVQNGNSNTLGLAKSDILFGTLSSTEDPVVKMNHVGTMLKVTVRNGSASPFTVNTLVLDTGKARYTLNVTGGTDIAAGASADFYFMADPFEIKAGGNVQVFLSASNGNDTCNIAYSAAKSYPAGASNTLEATFSPVTMAARFSVKKNASGHWRVYKNDEEFYIKGASANNFYDKVAGFGGNVIRTYSVAQTKEMLDIAQNNGTYVLSGVAIGRETDGYDYNNTDKVAEQKESVRKQVQEIMNHPALMGYVVGNEADASFTNMKVWSALGEIAAMIKEMDPNHLVTTALAGTKANAIAEIRKVAPDVDFLSINMYYSATHNVQGNLDNAGWDKPWVMSEFGPRGTWALTARTEPPCTSWNACVEQTSTEKAAVYKDIYENAIAANKDNGCIGSCIFEWGYQTHGAVLTWYSLFDKRGYATEAVDEAQKAWTGSYPALRAPRIKDREAMLIDDRLKADDDVVLGPSTAHTASVDATSPNGAALSYNWMIYRESDHASDGSLPEGMTGLIEDATKADISFKAPSITGNYRMVVFVSDDNARKVAVAVIPFQVGQVVDPGTGSEVEGGLDPWQKGNENW